MTGRAMLTRAFLMLEVAKQHRASREMGGFVNVNVNVKEGCRLQAMGYRVVRVENGRWKGFWGREPVPQAPGGPRA